MSEEKYIEISSKVRSDVKLQIYSESKREDSLQEVEFADAIANGESPYQLMEGYSYEYYFSNENYELEEIAGIVRPSRRGKNSGRITPKIYVGTLQLTIIESESKELIDTIALEVRSVKADYRSDYRFMLEEITEKCTELIMQCNSPVNQSFSSDFENDNKTAYQRFAFVRSLIYSDEFNNAVNKIISSPVTEWEEEVEQIDIRRVKRIRNSGIRQIAGNSNRSRLPDNHPLHKLGLHTIPSKIQSSKKIETVDTPENRFIKHVLKEFHSFCSSFELIAKGKAQLEAKVLVDQLDCFINHSVFKKVSRPTTLNLNSPVLQRKEGYREVLRAWIMFDLAAKLIWEGGEDVYEGGKRDVATLYEYWLFFKLLDLVSELFRIEPKQIEKLIQPSNDNLSLSLKQGKNIALSGVYDSGIRKLHIKFSFNRSFSGRKTYPDSGSWTRTLRPDYTLSIWPNGISEEVAEQEELITHIHFDAKYKVENLQKSFTEDVDLNEEKMDQREGKYKNADLLKMHAYKDAIRRTGGAYVLYPGNQVVRQEGFHEIIPGLGAFPIRPTRGDDGTNNLKEFINEIISHFLNRASQWENMSYRVYDIHKGKPDKLEDLLPEPYGDERGLIPEETTVLVGFYKSKEHLEWCKSKGLYNFRSGEDNGALLLDKDVVNARYLLLHTYGDKHSGELLRITGKGLKVKSGDFLIQNEYPKDPKKEMKPFYLTVEIDDQVNEEFKGLEWDFKKFEKFKTGNQSARPFAVSLSELMKKKVQY
ncbi:DUF2357 domain-containing protein [Marinifilum sp. RC60d5]|uniref:DUF2357 domain-containing protein n=1 Tax=Marinifilum sp. RC60d5 TaxID=3458414 RepID=UPI00403566B8